MRKKISQQWEKLSLLGTKPEMSHHLKRRLALGNQVAFSAGVITAILAIPVYDQPPQIITHFLAVILCASHLYLNSIGQYNLARAAILFFIPCIILVGGFYTSQEIKATQKFAICMLVIIPLVLYGITRTRSMIFGLLWVTSCYILYDWGAVIFPVSSVPDFSPGKYIHFEYFSAFFNFLVVSLAFTYLQRLNHKSESSLQELLTHSKKQNTEIEKQKEKLEKAYKQLEILNIRTQMNPHFLYNSLNSIQHFITKNEKQSALQYLSNFSRLMRQYLSYNDQAMIPIEEEISLLKNYIKLETLRFAGKFESQIKYDELSVPLDIQIPFLLIQPFVENAVLHGLLPKDGNGKLIINFASENDYLVCSIEDNGIGREKAKSYKKNNADQHDSKGIILSSERLRLIYEYEDNVSPIEIIDLISSEHIALGTRVVISIPI